MQAETVVMLSWSSMASFFPLRRNALVVSHPVNVWNPKIARITLLSCISAKIDMLMSLRWHPVPVCKNNGFDISVAKYSRSKKTSVFGEWTTISSQLFWAAWKQWSIMRLSASSWDEHSECTMVDFVVTWSLLVKRVHCSADANMISLSLSCSAYLSSSHNCRSRLMKFLLFSSLDKKDFQSLGVFVDCQRNNKGCVWLEPLLIRSRHLIDFTLYESVTKWIHSAWGKRWKIFSVSWPKVSGIFLREWSRAFPSMITSFSVFVLLVASARAAGLSSLCINTLVSVFVGSPSCVARAHGIGLSGYANTFWRSNSWSVLSINSCPKMFLCATICTFYCFDVFTETLFWQFWKVFSDVFLIERLVLHIRLILHYRKVNVVWIQIKFDWLMIL